MSNLLDSIQNELKCPICLDLLRSPITSLPCQHKMCQACVGQICEPMCSSQNSCPVCRFKFTVDQVQRDHVLENVTQILHDRKVSGETRSGDELKPTEEQTYSDDKAVSSYLSAKTRRQDLSANLDAKIARAKQLVASRVFVEVDSLVQEITDEVQNVKTNVHRHVLNLNSLAEDLAPHTVQGTFGLLENAIEMSCLIPEDDLRLQCLLNVSSSMQFIANTMAKTNKTQEFTTIGLKIMDNIFNAVEGLNVYQKKKAESLAWCLKFTGVCCNMLGLYFKSLELNRRALRLLEEEFGIENSKHLRLYGMCNHNIGVAYKRSNLPTKAREAYIVALEVYLVAKDWKCESQKQESLTRTVNSLKTVA